MGTATIIMLRESTTTSTSVSLPVRVVVVLHRFFLIMVNIAFLHRWEVEEGGGGGKSPMLLQLFRAISHSCGQQIRILN